HLDGAVYRPQTALLVEATREGAHSVGLRVRVLGPLCRRALCKQHKRTDQFVAPLDLIHEVKLQLGKVPHRFHSRSSSPCAPGPLQGPDTRFAPTPPEA